MRLRRPAFVLRDALLLRGSVVLCAVFVLRELMVRQAASLPGVPDSRPAWQALLLHFVVHLALCVELRRSKLRRPVLCRTQLRRPELRRFVCLDVQLRLLDVLLQVL